MMPSSNKAAAATTTTTTTEGKKNENKQKPVILTNCTDTHFKYPDDVRKEERWPKDSPEYKAGNARINRYKPPKPEIEGDVFDRQRVIVGFNQGIIEKQRCFVLGTGGIGQDVALTLARLGVGRIIMLDCDSYDASNLTRQCLGSMDDVGKRKVDAAFANIKAHNIRSEIETVHIDALKHWDQVVSIAKRCDVIFNGIDLGPMWDYCVCSLAKEVGVPYIAGQSYDWMFNTEFYSGDKSKLCAWCATADTEQKWISSQFGTHFGLAGDIKYISQRLKDFMAADHDNKTYQQIDHKCLVEFLKFDRTKFRMKGPSLPPIVQAALNKCSSSKSSEKVSSIEISELIVFLEHLMTEVVTRLLPGKISKLKEVEFIPHPKHVETRFVGSWVCPCLAAGVIMVSQFANYLTGRKEDAGDPPCNITFNLGWGQTVEEQGFQQTASMVQQGIFPASALENITAPRPRSSTPSKKCCMLCNAAQKLSTE